MIKFEQLLKRYNKIWDNISKSFKKWFDNQPVCNEKYLKTKIKSYEGKTKTHFHDNGMTKIECSQCICLSVASINSVFNIGKSCYAQVVLEEFKYIVKGKKVKNYILGGLELSLDDLDVETSD